MIYNVAYVCFKFEFTLLINGTRLLTTYGLRSDIPDETQCYYTLLSFIRVTYYINKMNLPSDEDNHLYLSGRSFGCVNVYLLHFLVRFFEKLLLSSFKWHSQEQDGLCHYLQIFLQICHHIFPDIKTLFHSFPVFFLLFLKAINEKLWFTLHQIKDGLSQNLHKF